MILLPPIDLARQAAGLPLSEDSARQIAAILLAEEPTAQSSLWTELLAADPPLLLWASLLHARSGLGRPAHFGELAAWLAPRALLALDWSQPAASVQELPAGESIRWRDAMRHCWQAHEQHSGGQATDTASSGASLLGLLKCVLAAIGAAPHDSPALALSPRELPGWLAELASDSAADPLPPASQADAVSPELKRTLRRWRTKTTGSGGMLPRLTERLRRLRSLETDFEQTLLDEKLSAMRELAYGASHEINNPLANISTRAQTLLQEEHNPERRRKLATIHLQAMRAHEMIANLMHFAKPPKLLAEPVDLGACLTAAADELAEWSDQQGTPITVTIPEQGPLIEGDRQQLMIALRAMLRNSLEALAAGGRIDAEVLAIGADGAALQGSGERGEGSDGLLPEVVVRIRDNGPGVSDEARPHLFDPFYSGREAGRGLGFGLAWSWRIIQRHGGRIEVDSQAGHGAEFRVILPVVRRTA